MSLLRELKALSICRGCGNDKTGGCQFKKELSIPETRAMTYCVRFKEKED